MRRLNVTQAQAAVAAAALAAIVAVLTWTTFGGEPDTADTTLSSDTSTSQPRSPTGPPQSSDQPATQSSTGDATSGTTSGTTGTASGGSGRTQTSGTSSTSTSATSSTSGPRSSTSTSATSSTTSTTSTSTTSTSTTSTTTEAGPRPQFITFDGWRKTITENFEEAIGALSSSGLPISYTLKAGPEQKCQIKGVRLVVPVRPAESGSFPVTCTIEASQGGNADYLPAASVQRRIVVEQGVVVLRYTDSPSGDGWKVTVTAKSTGVLQDISVSSYENATVEPQEGSGATLTVQVTPLGPGPVSVTFIPVGDLVKSAWDGQAVTWNAVAKAPSSEPAPAGP